MNEKLHSYIDPAFRYVFAQGTDAVNSREQALADGINCISLGHLVIKDLFGYTLTSNLKSSELSTDNDHFEELESAEDMQLGDLVWFGLENPDVEIDDFVPDYVDGELLNACAPSRWMSGRE